MRAHDLALSREYSGTWVLSVKVDDIRTAQHLYDSLHDSDLDVEIRKHREKRSLTANAYFHVLCGKLAQVTGASADEMKRWLVRQYGTLATKDGVEVVITLPKGVNPLDYYPYVEWLGTDDRGEAYALYKQTHVLDSQEFARLLDGTVSECKAMGIETLPADELRRLYAQADKGMPNHKRN